MLAMIHNRSLFVSSRLFTHSAHCQRSILSSCNTPSSSIVTQRTPSRLFHSTQRMFSNETDGKPRQDNKNDDDNNDISNDNKQKKNNQLTPAPEDNFWEQVVKVVGGVVVALASLRMLAVGVGSAARVGPLAAPIAIGTVITSSLHFLINRLRLPWPIAAFVLCSPIFAAGVYITYRDDEIDQGRLVMESAFASMMTKSGLRPRCLQFTRPEAVEGDSMLVKVKAENVMVDGEKRRGMISIQATKASDGVWQPKQITFDADDKQVVIFQASA